ncbi:GbsR/MarR family transcriptional regulator [Nonomuraea sp. NPDC050790]|uniref:GbsR/MarR family transcriptional regulator n=1 Tax=Nonomuraea sp. NPDC050790 TaxID=3364371 RepID=UPI003794EE7F
MDRTALHDYADEIGAWIEGLGLPRMAGRVLGWLMVCEPPHQSADELAEALQASRGAISMSVRMLMAGGSVERHLVPGTRRTYYRMRPGFWLREAEDKARMAGEWRKVTERGLELLSDRGEDSRRRMQEAHDMYAFLEQEYGRIQDRWLEHQAKKET